MSSFLNQVAQEIIDTNSQLDSLMLVLPGNGSIFQIKKTLKAITNQKQEMPEFFVMQSFMQKVSNLSLMPSTHLLFESYKLYRKYICKTTQSFENFLTWAPKALEDFNSLDLHMIEIEPFFSQMQSIEKISQWSRSIPSLSAKEHKKTVFWEPIARLYSLLKDGLLSKKQAYQGLVYREAANKIKTFLLELSCEKRIIFAGMNPLSKSEENVMEYLLDQKRAEVYWNTDEYFMNPQQEAGFFIRKYRKNWSSLQGKKIQWIDDGFKKAKTIKVIETVSQVGQAKKAGLILKELLEKGHDFSKTAVVFPEPSLLFPFLESIPQKIPKVNISANCSLQNTCWHHVFELIFRVFLNRERSTEKAFYGKDVLDLFSERYLQFFFHHQVKELTKEIYKRNLFFISEEFLKNHLKEGFVLNMLSSKNLSPKNYIDMLLGIIKKFYSRKEIQSELSYLKPFEDFFRSLELNATYISNLSTLDALYKKWIISEFYNLSNEFFEGLQVLGIFETSSLDFDTVVITSMNEGIFPPDKTHFSWIPFDVRLQIGLPAYRDHDALYACLFYSLLQRAQHVYLIYNTQDRELGSKEKSRFIYQLEIESPHQLVYEMPKPLTDLPKVSSLCIAKTPCMIKRLEEMAAFGFSTSSIGLYIRCPIMFYKEKVLGLLKQEELKESIQKHTHGTLIHKLLEKLYLPFLNQRLDLRHCVEMRAQISPMMKDFFQKFHLGNHQKGKNILIYQVVEKQLEAFINWEENNLRNNQNISIVSLEKSLSMSLDLTDKVRISGKIDRIDECNGQIRIIDYKSGYINPLSLKLNSVDLGKIVQEVRFDKALQLLLYACLYQNLEKDSTYRVCPYIFSFRKAQEGLQPLLIDSQKHVSKELTEVFLPFLHAKVKEILNPEIPFKEQTLPVL